MALDNVTLARPYAKAIFELGKTSDQLVHWSLTLATLTQICLDHQVKRLIASPLVSSKQIVAFFSSVCETALDGEGKGLLQLLAAYKRLAILPAIKDLFEQYRADYEKTITVAVSSFMPLTQQQQQLLTHSLALRLGGRKISLCSSVDKNLLGGAVIRAGDLVIDGSLRGQLDKMARAIV